MAYKYAAIGVERGRWGAFICLNLPGHAYDCPKDLVELMLFKPEQIEISGGWFPVEEIFERLIVLDLCIEMAKTATI